VFVCFLVLVLLVGALVIVCGDFDVDGFVDLVVGVFIGCFNGKYWVGDVYVIYGVFCGLSIFVGY